jgi:hypothetical protein
VAKKNDISPLEEQLKSELTNFEMAPPRDFFDAINEKVSKPEGDNTPDKSKPRLSKKSKIGLIAGASLLILISLIKYSTSTTKDELPPATTPASSKNEIESTPSEGLNETIDEHEVQELSDPTPTVEVPQTEDIPDSITSDATSPLGSTGTLVDPDQALNEGLITTDEVNEVSNWQNYINSNADTNDLQELFDD